MIKIHTLQNGLRVVTEAIPFVRSVSFGLWVNNGSRHETPATSGISHFIEHMMFKGTQKRSALEIAEVMDAVGGQLNAFTSKEQTCYYTRTLDTHFDVALDVISDMFFNSKYEPDEIDKERNVILEEISMYEDTPEDLCVDYLHAKVFPGHALGMPILGTPETIASFTQASFKDFTTARYTPHNVVISVAGNIDDAQVLEKITNIFGNFGMQKLLSEAFVPAVYTPGFAMRDKDIEQVHLCMGFPGIPGGTQDVYALAAVNAVFGGGMSSRLFQKIREERGLVYSVYSYNAGYADAGLFSIYAALNPAQLKDALGLITEEVQRMFTDRITPSQLSKAKEQLKSSFLLSLESAASRMSSIGRSVITLGKVVTPDELVAKIDAIDMDSFYEICNKIFQLDKVSLSLVGKSLGDSAEKYL